MNDFAGIGKYIWHGVGHPIGLNTHDVGDYEELMVFTVDAGIYVREWGIELRSENHVLVTAYGCEDLSEAIPAPIEGIDSFAAGKRSATHEA